MTLKNSVILAAGTAVLSDHSVPPSGTRIGIEFSGHGCHWANVDADGGFRVEVDDGAMSTLPEGEVAFYVQWPDGSTARVSSSPGAIIRFGEKASLDNLVLSLGDRRAQPNERPVLPPIPKPELDVLKDHNKDLATSIGNLSSVIGAAQKPGTLAGELERLVGVIGSTDTTGGTLSGEVKKVGNQVTALANMIGNGNAPGTLAGEVSNVGSHAAAIARLIGKSDAAGTLAGEVKKAADHAAALATHGETLRSHSDNFGKLLGDDNNESSFRGAAEKLHKQLKDDGPLQTTVRQVKTHAEAMEKSARDLDSVKGGLVDVIADFNRGQVMRLEGTATLPPGMPYGTVTVEASLLLSAIKLKGLLGRVSIGTSRLVPTDSAYRFSVPITSLVTTRHRVDGNTKIGLRFTNSNITLQVTPAKTWTVADFQADAVKIALGGDAGTAHQRTITGTAAHSAGVPIPRLSVQAFRYVLSGANQPELLGAGETDESGRFTIEHACNEKVDAYVEAYAGEGPKKRLVGSSAISYGVGRNVEINVLVWDLECLSDADSELAKVHAALADTLKDNDPLQLTTRDVFYLAERNELMPIPVAHYVAACMVAKADLGSRSTEPPSTLSSLYALTRHGGASATAIGRLGNGRFERTLNAAIAGSTVKRPVDTAERIQEKLGTHLRAAALGKGTRSPLVKTLQITGLDANRLSKFLEAYEKEQPAVQTILENAGLTTADADKLLVALMVNAVAEGDAGLTEAILKQWNPASAADIATREPAEWQNLAQQPGLSGDALAADAERLARRARRAFPGKASAHFLKDVLKEAAVWIGEKVKTDPSFDLRGEWLSKGSAPEQVRQAQRLLGIVGDPANGAVAAKISEVKSALELARRGRMLVASAGTNGAEILLRARFQAGAAIALQERFGQGNARNLCRHAPELNASKVNSKDRSRYRELFPGDVDMNVPEHCSSILGPPAYLVDLLDFVRELNGEPQLHGRRPDLYVLPLSCEHTETVLPTIDLVNELLETLISKRPPKPPPSGIDPSELMCRPLVVDEEVYVRLQKSVGEFGGPRYLPFDLWVSELRLYLKQTGVSRVEIMERVGRRCRADLAEESLELPRGFVRLDFPGTATPREWGFSTDASQSFAVDLAGVPVFLRKTGLSYAQLEELLACPYVLGGVEDGGKVVRGGIRFLPHKGAESAWIWTGEQAPSSDESKSLDLGVLARVWVLLRLHQSTQLNLFELGCAIEVAYALAKEEAGNGRPVEPSGTLVQLDQILRLRRECGVDLMSVLSFWGNIETRGPVVDGTQRSLYDQVFRKEARPKESGGDPLALKVLGASTFVQVRAELQSALRLSASDLDSLVGDWSKALSLEDLSRIYRVATLAQAVHLKPRLLVQWLELRGYADPVFPSPATLRTLLSDLRLFETHNFSLEEIDFATMEKPANHSRLALDASQLENVRRQVLEAIQGTQSRSAGGQRTQPTIDALSQAVAVSLEMDPLIAQQLLSANPAIAQALGTLLDDENMPDDVKDALAELHRAAFALSKVPLALQDKLWLIVEARAYGLPDHAYKQGDPQGDRIARWVRLLRLCETADVLCEEAGPDTDRLLRLLGPAAIDAEKRRKLILSSANWEEGDVKRLRNDAEFGATGAVDTLVDLHACFKIVRSVGLSIEQLQSMASTANVNRSLADIAYAAARARCSDAARWTETASALRADLRVAQRNALTSAALQIAKCETAEQLSEKLLQDVAIGPIATTSRMVFAIAAVQSFVARIQLGLEAELSLSSEQEERWRWMRHYRVSEAARKVFLYPENWIEPELRDDCTPEFAAFETALMHGAVTDASAEAALVGYLDGLDELAKLEVCALNIEHPGATAEVIHVFARTPSSPTRYYYRRWLDRTRWTPWERAPEDIEGVHLVPVVMNGRVLLFWARFQEQRAPAEQNEESGNQQLSDDSEMSKLRVMLSWSEYQYGVWGPTSTSEEYVETAKRKNHNARNVQLRIVEHTDETLAIGCYEVRRNVVLGGTWTALLECDDALLSAVEGMTSELDSYTRTLRGRFRYDCVSRKVVAESADDAPARYPVPEGWTPDGMGFSHQKSGEPLTLPCGLDGIELAEMDVFKRVVDHALLIPSAQIGEEPFQSQMPFCLVLGACSTMAIPELEVLPRRAGGGKVDRVWSNPLLNRGESHIPVRVRAERGGETSSDPEKVRGRSMPQWFLGKSNRSDIASTACVVESILDDGRAVALAEAVRLRMVKRRFRLHILSHPGVRLAALTLQRSGVGGLLGANAEEGLRYQEANGAGPILRWECISSFVALTPEPSRMFVFDRTSPNGIYNWELFFHIPMYVAGRLRAELEFDAAKRWYEFIFDPTTKASNGSSPTPADCWCFGPFRKGQAEASVSELGLLLGEDAPAADESKLDELLASLVAWLDDPFNPHRIAQIRIGAYERAIVQKYLENLIAWGDHHFIAFTGEDLTQAALLYEQAANVLGPEPVMVPTKPSAAPTFEKLQAGEAETQTVALENVAVRLLRDRTMSERDPHYSAVSVAGGPQRRDATRNRDLTRRAFSPALPPISASLLARGSSGEENGKDQWAFFATPPNKQLLDYWKTVGRRRELLRSSRDIDGNLRQPPLFEPEIDPAELIRARAAGLSTDAGQVKVSETLSHYRYRFLVQRALNLCSVVQSFGGSLQAALEKRDGEALSALRDAQERRVLDLEKEVYARRVAEAGQQVRALERARDIAQTRMVFYRDRERQSAQETAQLGSLIGAGVARLVGAGLTQIAGALGSTPQFGAGTSGNGAHCVVSVGGEQLGFAFASAARGCEIAAQAGQDAAVVLGISAGYERREQEWDHLADLGKLEVKQAEIQLGAAKTRLEISERERIAHNERCEQAAQRARFMREKFSSGALYAWEIGELSALYLQSYRLAVDVAGQAQRAFKDELGERADFVGYGSWNGLRKGLVAGDRLQSELERMDLCYLEHSKRRAELKKIVSLAAVDPAALFELRASGVCKFKISETWFDADFPGHYRRRIKTVHVTMPCVTGPYVGVTARLTLSKSAVRPDGSLDSASDGKIAETVCLSSCNNDSGLFQVQLDDPMYLPFEGRGVESEWSLELTSVLEQIDRRTISDVLLHIDYTARDAESGDSLPSEAKRKVEEEVGSESGPLLTAVVDVGQVCPDRLRALTSLGGADVLEVPMSADWLPSCTRNRACKVHAVSASATDEHGAALDLSQWQCRGSLFKQTDRTGVWQATLRAPILVGPSAVLTVQRPQDGSVPTISSMQLVLHISAKGKEVPHRRERDAVLGD